MTDAQKRDAAVRKPITGRLVPVTMPDRCPLCGCEGDADVTGKRFCTYAKCGLPEKNWPAVQAALERAERVEVERKSELAAVRLSVLKEAHDFVEDELSNYPLLEGEEVCRACEDIVARSVMRRMDDLIFETEQSETTKETE